MKSKDLHPRLLYPAKLSFRMEGMIKCFSDKVKLKKFIITSMWSCWEDGGKIGGSGIHFPSAPGKYLADLRSRANSQQYSSIYED